VALAFGLTVLTMAYAIGHISGCHLNPAVSIGAWAGGPFPSSKRLPYIVSLVLGAIAAGGILYHIVSGRRASPGLEASLPNGYGAHSPGGYSLFASRRAKAHGRWILREHGRDPEGNRIVIAE
jgi:aquaporin Z